VSSRRIYRQTIDSRDLVTFTVVSGQTDLLIQATHDVRRQALDSVARHRTDIESYLHTHARFATSLQPVVAPDDAPAIICAMAAAACAAGTGPMSAVAGAVAEAVGFDLLEVCDEVIIENGGDLFIHTLVPRTVALYAGQSPLSGRIGIVIDTIDHPIGVCTSTGTFGHSLSLGRADACTVVARSTALADAVATSLCNRVRTENDLAATVDMAATIDAITGVVVILGHHIAIRGQLRLASI